MASSSSAPKCSPASLELSPRSSSHRLEQMGPWARMRWQLPVPSVPNRHR
uniref:Uncharacterized protein n=1 Tax=Arundo donax TaxID=35708 RepID=A0A0A9B076_ARUDO